MKYEISKRNIIVLAGISFLILFFTLRGEFTLIWAELTHANPLWILLSISCIILYWYFDARTLHMMLKSYDSSISFFQIMKLIVSTQFFNGITPFATGGQPFQIYVLSTRSKLPVSSVTSASVHNFIMYQTALVFMGVVAIFTKSFFPIFPGDSTSGMRFFAWIGFGVNTLIIILLFIIAISPKLTENIINFVLKAIRKTPLRKKIDAIDEKIHRTTAEFHKDIQLLMNDKQVGTHAFLLNLCKLSSFYFVSYAICRSVGFANITIVQALVASAYVMLITSVIPLPGASGGAEMGFLLFFSSFITGPSATAIMLLWRFVTYYIGLLTGFIVFYFGYPRGSKI